MIAFGEDNPGRQAFEALSAGQYVRALSMIDQLLAAEPANAMYLCWHAHCLLSLDNPLAAFASVRKAVELAPRLPQAYVVLAWTARRLGRRQEAQDAFEMALTLTGRDAAVLTEYADFLAIERAPGVAEPIAREAAAAQPDSPTAWRALGWTLLRLHKHDEAEQCLQRALDGAPDDPATLYCMVELFTHTGRPERAEALARTLGRIPAVADVAEELRRQAARRLRALGRGDPRFDRFLPPVEDRAAKWRFAAGQALRRIAWGLAVGAVAVGLAAMVLPGLKLPWRGMDMIALGVLVGFLLWYRRNR